MTVRTRQPFDALGDQFTPDRVAGLDRLLLLREPGGVTWLEWLRTPAADGSARPIVGQIEKLRELQALEADLVDLTMLPPGRVRILASEARRRSAWELSRLPPARRYPVLLVFIAEMIVERGDELIDLYCKAILNAERHARQHVKDQREKTARARDERSLLAGTLARILLDAADGGEDPLARALREVGAQRLRAAVEDPGALARPIEEQRRDALGNRHAHLAQFARDPRGLGSTGRSRVSAAAGRDQPCQREPVAAGAARRPAWGAAGCVAGVDAG